VAHGALGCSDVYGMLQKVVVGLCHVRSHTLELDHKMCSQRVLSVFLWQSLDPLLYIRFAVCLCVGALLFFEKDVVSRSF
jgi:hypothetical protein